MPPSEPFAPIPFSAPFCTWARYPPKPPCGNAWTARAAGRLAVWERQSVVSGQTAGLFPLRRGHRLPPGGGEKQSIKPAAFFPVPWGQERFVHKANRWGNPAGLPQEIRPKSEAGTLEIRYSGNNATMDKIRFITIIFRDVSFVVIFWGILVHRFRFYIAPSHIWDF